MKQLSQGKKHLHCRLSMVVKVSKVVKIVKVVMAIIPSSTLLSLFRLRADHKVNKQQGFQVT